MDDGIEAALADLGLDQPNPLIAAQLWGRIAAEPTVLETWARDSRHPALAPAYRALYLEMRPRVAQRLVAIRAAAGFPDGAFEAARAEAVAQGEATQHELTRLTWLLARRRERLQARAVLEDQWPAEVDADEAMLLEDLLSRHRRGLC